MKGFVSCLLILTLVAPLYARELSVEEQAGKIKLGAKTEVTLQTGEVLKGRRGASSNTGFSLEPMKDGQGTARTLEFREIQRVRQTGLSTAEKVAIISVAALGAVVLGFYIWIKESGC